MCSRLQKSPLVCFMAVAAQSSLAPLQQSISLVSGKMLNISMMSVSERTCQAL